MLNGFIIAAALTVSAHMVNKVLSPFYIFTCIKKVRIIAFGERKL